MGDGSAGAIPAAAIIAVRPAAARALRSETEDDGSAPAADRPARALHLSGDAVAARAGEVPSLDGLRAVCILLVLCGHFVSGRVFPGGLGVLVFFAISGFLITRLLFAEAKRSGTIALPSFYVRRFLRLCPVVVAYLAFVLVAAACRGTPIPWLEPLSVLLYFTNYAFALSGLSGGDPVLPIGIFWSLAIEEHFYLVFPPLLWLVGARPRAVLGLALAAIVGALAIRIDAAARHPEYLSTYYFYTHSETRMDSLATGVLVAALCEIARGRALLARLGHPALVAAALVGVAASLAWRDPWFREVPRYTLLNASAGVLLVAILFSGRYGFAQRLLNDPRLAGIGRLSYSLYVWHLGVADFSGTNGLPDPLRIPAQFALSFVVAFASYRFIEQPFRALRGRFGPARPGAARRVADLPRVATASRAPS